MKTGSIKFNPPPVNNAFHDAMAQLIKEENPCNIQTVDGTVTCACGTPCCKGCNHLTPSGCSVKSVACKFYFCHTAWARCSNALKDNIRSLGRLAAQSGVEPRFRYDGKRNRRSLRTPFVW